MRDLIKLRFFKTMNTSLKLGAFDHASFIFQKMDHHHHLFIKNQDFKISKKKKSHAFISKLGAFNSASFK